MLEHIIADRIAAGLTGALVKGPVNSEVNAAEHVFLLSLAEAGETARPSI
jgi:hypothetical protein